MIANAQSYQTILNEEGMGGLGEIQILHPPGTFALTPASHIAIQSICNCQHLLAGNGLDWGSGAGCLTIVAAKIEKVKWVVGLDISAANVEVAGRNAILNEVADKTAFFLADSYKPFAQADQEKLGSLRGQTNFILSNPPASEGDDGFEYRRIVLRGACEFLVPGGVVFLNISYQYGRPRVERLSQEITGFRYEGLIANTDWVPFDLQRPDLLDCIVDYAKEERRGGLKYDFGNPQRPEVAMDAQMALAYFRQTGLSPLSQWQTHLFRFEG